MHELRKMTEFCVQQHKPNILVVDDEPSGIDFLVECLHENYDVQAATSGQQALRLLTIAEKQGQLPDLILLDVMMPIMSGFETFRAIRKISKLASEIPVIFVTASNDIASEIHALEIGGSDFIQKPFQLRVVEARVQLHLNLIQKQRELTRLNQQLAKSLMELDLINEKILHTAYHDSLTGLPNRALFFDRFNKALLSLKRRNEKLALLLIDLVKFKPLNDTYGHSAGDAVLVEMARRMTSCVRGSDTVGRLGGDEFVILLENLPTLEAAKMIADKVQTVLNKPVVYEGKSLALSGSIGGVLITDASLGADELIKIADAAMYGVKKGNGNKPLIISD